MTEIKIPQSAQEILDTFIRFNFRPISYRTLAENLNKKVDTIIQRIRRNREYFEVDDSQRPSRISIKKGIKEIYLFRDKNRCQICQKTVNPERLILKFRNPYQDDKFEWKNVLSVCDECKDKEIVKVVKKVKKAQGFEYKEIYIKYVYKKNPETDDYENYYEFDELDGSGYFPLIDENEKIASTRVADILSYFGADDWEVVYIKKQEDIDYELEDYQVIFKRKREK